MSISSTSSETSWAVTASWRAKDTSVAVRRCSVKLAMFWALVVTAYCARALIRLAGTFIRLSGPTSNWRTSVRRARAWTRTGALAREGARRRRSKFEHQEGMIEQVGTPARRGAEMFADAHQQSLDVGAGWMGGAAGTRGLSWRLQGGPVEEGEERAVAVHHGIGVQELAQRRLVNLLRAWYDRGHEQCSFQSRLEKRSFYFAQELVSLSSPAHHRPLAHGNYLLPSPSVLKLVARFGWRWNICRPDGVFLGEGLCA